MSEQTLHFGPFRLFRAQRTLMQGDRRVHLGSRAVDILIALTERAGEVVSKNELMALAWPHSFVEESNLRVHIGALRKALGEALGGERYIVNISGRGYLFSIPVTRSPSPEEPPEEPPEAPPPGRRAPEGENQIFGRAAAVGAIVQQLTRRRLVSIVGPAGVGKSTVAYAVAETSMTAFEQGGRVVELAAVQGRDGPAMALATALGVSASPDDALRSLVAFLKDQRLLIVLDNCEHVLDAIAVLAQRILSQTNGVSFLATSREPISIGAETIHRLHPLEVPGDSADLTATVALTYPAIELFVARAMASSDAFEFGDAEAPAVADICRRLDGLPLAIELVAARVDLFGLRALASELDDRLMMETQRSRSAQPRQQSIRAALDWSYALLSPIEALILRRFSVFRGPFSLESAAAVAAGDEFNVSDVLSALSLLTDKSLVGTDTTGAVVHYRLLHVTRAYASQKLYESGEAKALARTHAVHHCTLLAASQLKWETMTRAEWLAEYGHAIDDVRAALDWAFSADGDPQIGAALTISALPFGFQLSLIEEFRRRAEIALKAVSESNQPNPIAELRLLTALSVVDLNGSLDNLEIEANFARAARIAAEVDQPRYKVEILLARSIFQLEKGDLDRAIAIVSDLSDNARQADDPLATLLADRVAAQVYHFSGDHRRARMLAERVLRHPAKAIPLVYSQASINRRVSMRLVLARILWLEGDVDQAIQLMDECMEMAHADGPFALCFALAFGACPLALWTGDMVKSEALTTDLLDYGQRFARDRWRRLGEGFHAFINRKNVQTSGPFATLDIPSVTPASQLQREVLATVDERHVDADLAVRAMERRCGWCNPEILRAIAEQVLRQGGATAPVQAENLFLQSIEQAREQGALSWELRTATSLAMLLARQDRRTEAQDRLGGVLGRFSEGHGTADLRRAKRVLDEVIG